MKGISVLATFALLSACGQSGGTAAAPVETVTVTETVVATETDPGLVTEPSPSGSAEPPPMIGLTVHTDGCGLIREDVDLSLYENLTWTILDTDGFQVLGRNALGETRYRYFRGGTYSALLEAWDGEKYAPVSRQVEITC